jgi:TRAP-type C4-dicarboxylate transport system permease small subunit
MLAELESNTERGVIARLDDLFAGLERWLIVILLLCMIGLSFTQVVLRNFFSTGIDWADVVIRHMVLWVGLIGASIGAKEKRHLHIDIASRLIPAKWFHLVEAFLCLVTAAVSLLLFWASYLFVRFLYEWGTGMLEGKAALLAGLILPIAFAGVALRFLRRAFLELTDFWAKVRK